MVIAKGLWSLLLSQTLLTHDPSRQQTSGLVSMDYPISKVVIQLSLGESRADSGIRASGNVAELGIK